MVREILVDVPLSLISLLDDTLIMPHNARRESLPCDLHGNVRKVKLYQNIAYEYSLYTAEEKRIYRATRVGWHI